MHQPAIKQRITDILQGLKRRNDYQTAAFIIVSLAAIALPLHAYLEPEGIVGLHVGVGAAIFIGLFAFVAALVTLLRGYKREKIRAARSYSEAFPPTSAERAIADQILLSLDEPKSALYVLRRELGLEKLADMARQERERAKEQAKFAKAQAAIGRTNPAKETWTALLASKGKDGFDPKKVSVYDQQTKLVGTCYSIGEALRLCPEGGLIVVPRGSSYREKLHITKGVHLIGVDKPVLICDKGMTLCFDGESCANASVSGLKFMDVSLGRWAAGMAGIPTSSQVIACLNGADPFIEDNEVDAFAGTAIACWSSSPTIARNRITRCLGNGIFLEDSAAAVVGNTIQVCNDGILCSDGTVSVINGNSITNCFENGIFAYHCSPTVSGNSITGNKRYGIWLCPSATATDNTIEGNGHNIRHDGVAGQGSDGGAGQPLGPVDQR